VNVSVVISTFNRQRLLVELLEALSTQTLAKDAFEVIVVDDGSKEPVAPALQKLATPYPLRVITQANAGVAAARHRGIEAAAHEIIVVTDDDMLVPPSFLEEHRRAHLAGHTVVLGHIGEDEALLAEKPLFERMHAEQLKKFVARYRSDPRAVKGVHVCTGNVSFRRSEYLRVGGFDRTLGRSEDRELGTRLEKSGARLIFSFAARSTNRSDHQDLDVWMKRNYLYGVYDSRIAKKHPDVEVADPWHFLFLVNPVSRSLLLVSVASPDTGRVLSRFAYDLAEQIDTYARGQPPPIARALERLATAGATLAYGVEYFRGVREEAGSFLDATLGFAGYVKKRVAHGRGT
jgi:glycosyltransferase involved in cell wall biosynthesis